MSLIAVEAVITFADQEARDRAVESSVAIQQATRDDEAGCVVYCFAADPCRPDTVQVYELWESAADLTAHFEHANYHGMRSMLGSCGIVSAESRKHRIDATGPVYNPAGVAAAEFE